MWHIVWNSSVSYLVIASIRAPITSPPMSSRASRLFVIKCIYACTLSNGFISDCWGAEEKNYLKKVPTPVEASSIASCSPYSSFGKSYPRLLWTLTTDSISESDALISGAPRLLLAEELALLSLGEAGTCASEIIVK